MMFFKADNANLLYTPWPGAEVFVRSSGGAAVAAAGNAPRKSFRIEHQQQQSVLSPVSKNAKQSISGQSSLVRTNR